MAAFLAVVWSFIKKYWLLLVLVVVIVVGYFAWKRQQTSFADQLMQVQNIHTEEINRITAARDAEQKQHEANVQQLKDDLNVAQLKYDSAKKDLSASKKADAAAIVKKYGNDPVALANQLAAVFGFQVVMPK